ncbi:MAG: winged helix-turn-helix transcriptional regulator [Actinomycetia bacterium]|nr:winged helix-turn-helix transcriptional regulator [Actinomycetes bacterium]
MLDACTLDSSTSAAVLGNLTINYAGRRVVPAGRPVHLTPTEYRVLAELSANAGPLITYERLLDRVWGRRQRNGDVRPIRTIIGKLRRKLDDDANNPRCIFTEPRVGYRTPEADKPE